MQGTVLFVALRVAGAGRAAGDTDWINPRGASCVRDGDVV